eukprot:2500721-Heterocapsa_arctica.AAC.1
MPHPSLTNPILRSEYSYNGIEPESHSSGLQYKGACKANTDNNLQAPPMHMLPNHIRLRCWQRRWRKGGREEGRKGGREE